MRTRLCVLTLAFLVCLPLRADELKAGAARVDVTPPPGLPMWGYGWRRDAPCKGVRDRLHARALVLQAGKERLALVSLDLGRAPTRASTAAIRARVARDGNVTTLFLVASHTHHGPALEVADLPTPKTSYVRQLEGKLGDVILDACKKLRPARLGVAGKDARLNRNRHSKRDDKPVDPQLLVLRLEDADGKPIAHAVNFAAHPTMIKATDMRYSADYPGALCDRIEKETAAPCLFLQGAAGDLSPDSSGGRSTPEKFGLALAGEVLGVIRGMRCEKLDAPALKTAEDEFRFPCRVDVRSPVVQIAISTAFFPGLMAHFEREYRDGVRPRLTTAVLGGRIGFVGVSGEFFSGHALHLKKRARLEHLFFLGYCNDYHQYYPTIEAASEGGYGTETWIAAARIGAGERVMDRALLRLYQLRGKLPVEK